MFFKQFGGKVTSAFTKQYEQSKNWQNGCFQNMEPEDVVMPFSKIPGIIYKQLTSNKNKVPRPPLPTIPFDKIAFLTPSNQTKFIWYGHSVVLLQMEGKTLLIDPMLGPDTTPIAPIPTKRFSENSLDLIDDFPEIDILLITHDHYTFFTIKVHKVHIVHKEISGKTLCPL